MPSFQDLLASGARWDMAGDTARASQYFKDALEAAETPAQRAEAACRLSHVHRRRCEWDDAVENARISREAAREAGSTAREAEALNAQATVHQTRGEFTEAAKLFREILTLTDDRRTRALATLNLGSVTAQEGSYDEAAKILREAHAAFMGLHDIRGEAFALNSLGRALVERGDIQGGSEVLGDALYKARASLDVDIIALVTLNLAEVLFASGDLARAAELATESLGGFRSEGNRWRELESLRMLGDIANKAGETDVAERHYRRAFMLAEEIGAPQEIRSLRERLDKLAPA